MAQYINNQSSKTSKQYRVCCLFIINAVIHAMDNTSKQPDFSIKYNKPHRNQHLRIRVNTQPDNILFDKKPSNKTPRIIIKPTQPKTPKLIFFTGRNKLNQNNNIIIIEDDNDDKQIAQLQQSTPIESENKRVEQNNSYQEIESNKLESNDFDHKKYFDSYIDQQIEKNFGNPNQPNKLHIKTWEQLKQCIKFNRDLDRFYHCPYKFCSFCDDRQIDSVANCYVKHFDKIFFTCPRCKEKFEKYKILKDHYLNECALYNSELENSQLKTPVQKIVASYQPGIRPNVIALNDITQSPENYYAYQLNQCSYDESQNYLEEMNFNDF
ncbi:MAG: hypothetical protein ACOYT8_02585 [Candidatus Dependentiae bacterium]